MKHVKQMRVRALAVIDAPIPRAARATLVERQNATRERRPLTSWKEISRYLGHGVRTVQRYEVNLGLPIYRPACTQRGAVFAFPDELDLWVRSAPLPKSVRVDSALESKCGAPGTAENDRRTDLQLAEKDLRSAVVEYKRCLERYHTLTKSLHRPIGSPQVKPLDRAA